MYTRVRCRQSVDCLGNIDGDCEKRGAGGWVGGDDGWTISQAPHVRRRALDSPPPVVVFVFVALDPREYRQQINNGRAVRVRLLMLVETFFVEKRDCSKRTEGLFIWCRDAFCLQLLPQPAARPDVLLCAGCGG